MQRVVCGTMRRPTTAARRPSAGAWSGRWAHRWAARAQRPFYPESGM